MSTSKSVLNEIDVLSGNLSDSIQKYKALLVEEKLTSTNKPSLKFPMKFEMYKHLGCNPQAVNPVDTLVVQLADNIYDFLADNTKP